jgi:uncharacterized surface protein with fasciclin (FAS1) repeats
MKIVNILFFASLLVFASCEREDLTEIKPGILEMIATDPELSVLNQAIDRANLKGALAGTQYTFFAPVNSAFDNIDINSISENDLLNILKYHIAPTRYDSSRFNAEYGNFFGNPAQGNLVSLTTLNTTLNANLFFTNSSRVLNGNLEKDGVWVCGVRVSVLDAHEASDGIVHRIDQLLSPPTGLSGSTIASIPDLSLFNKLINKAATAAGAASFFTTTLNNVAIVTTVFAPNNSAMEAAGYNDAFIDSSTPAALLVIARGNVLNSTQTGFTSFRRFMSDFNKLYKDNSSSNVTYATFQTGRSVTFNGANGTVAGVLNTGVQVVGPNIVTSNGVIHIVGSVINN